jgi:hypothetical protein
MTRPDTPRTIREHHPSEALRQRLKAARLDDFESLWTLDARWVEEPNLDRRGWSGVCRLELPGTAGQVPLGVYLKRQENHGYRSLGNPFRYQPTAYREFQCLMAMQAAAISVPEVIYYGQRRTGKTLQALLMTREIPQNIPLDDYLRLADDRPAVEVDLIIRDTAALIGRLHRCHFQHCALYGKHVLISGFDNGKPGLAGGKKLVPVLIDVEKFRRRPSRLGIALKDLSQFYRRTPWSEPQWAVFLKHYVGVCGLPRIKPFLSWLIRQRVRRKQTQR